MRMAIEGLVLRELKTGENDKLLLVLTAKQGKIWVSAKGGRSIKSAKSAICRPFTYGELEIYDKGERIWLSGGSPINSFFARKLDVDGYSLAAYISELCEEITGEEQNAELVLSATLNCFYAIENQLFPLDRIKAAYELFAASVSGFCPELCHCIECQRELPSDGDELYLDVMNGGILCKDCAAQKKALTLQGEQSDEFETKSIILPLDAASLMALRYCASAHPKKLFNFSINDQKSMRLFKNAAECYLLNHLERGFKTLSFYKSL